MMMAEPLSFKDFKEKFSHIKIEEMIVYELYLIIHYLKENEQTQVIEILKQEIADTQAILEMLSEKLKGWS